ncbi:sulfatase-like hydrolase/transferase [Microbulbifer taiwanensis]|uniref:Sulfatase-like hydrolase/transferase n=1 Tax=Microbulbifer taiwanensis TaxID=986746 RepID=A0ABW1YGT2_9GAMM|nr:sulfatase-like hydrolase/transferase [Microbulbifer taiwanensis]
MRQIYTVLLLSAFLAACGGGDNTEDGQGDSAATSSVETPAALSAGSQGAEQIPRQRAAASPPSPEPAAAPAKNAGTRPNILLIVSDDTGVGDLGPYGGGEGRGMPTPNIDRMAAGGMTFFSFYAQPSCTPGRAAIQTGAHPELQRHDHRGLPGPGRWPGPDGHLRQPRRSGTAKG